MTKEDIQITLEGFSRQSFELGARSFATYLLRMRMEMHERRLGLVRGQGKALIHNRLVSADNDLEKYKSKLKVALDALLEDVDDLETVEEFDSEIRNSRDVFERGVGI